MTFDLVPDGDKHFILFFNYRYPFGRDRHRLTPFSFIKLVVLGKKKILYKVYYQKKIIIYRQ